MKSQNEILRWLNANRKRCTGGLTSQDVQALVTCVNMSNLVSYSGAAPELFDAFRAVAMQMQDSTRWLLFNAIACELDWGHRAMIWSVAGLPQNDMREIRSGGGQ